MIQPNIISIDETVPIIIFWHIFIDNNNLRRCIDIIQRQFKK